METANKPVRKRTRLATKFRNTITEFDLFGKEMDDQFQIDDIHLYKSILGTLLTVFFISLMGLYTIYKYQIMVTYNDTNVMTSLQENFFSYEYNMKGEKDNF